MRINQVRYTAVKCSERLLILSVLATAALGIQDSKN